MIKTIAGLQVVAGALVLLAGTPALAQDVQESGVRTRPGAPASAFQLSVDQAIDNAGWQTGAFPTGSTAQSPGSGRSRSVGRAILGGVVGAVGGFFGGAYLGAMIEGECNCDDPGF